MIVDAHLHLPTNEDRDLQGSRQKLLQDFRAAGIDYGIVIPDNVDGSGIGSLDEVLALTENDDNLFVMGTLNILKDDESIVDKLAGLMDNRKIVAVKIFPGHDEHYPNDPRLFSTFEALIEHDLPLVVHTGWNTDFLSGELYKYIPEVAKWNDPKYMVDIVKQFPRLKIVIAHLFWPKVEYCYDITKDCDNVYFDTSALADDEVIQATGMEEVTTVLEQIIKDDPKRLVFGSDYNCCPMGIHVELIESLSISDQARKQVFYQNAVELFGLNI